MIGAMTLVQSGAIYLETMEIDANVSELIIIKAIKKPPGVQLSDSVVIPRRKQGAVNARGNKGLGRGFSASGRLHRKDFKTREASSETLQIFVDISIKTP